MSILNVLAPRIDVRVPTPHTPSEAAARLKTHLLELDEAFMGRTALAGDISSDRIVLYGLRNDFPVPFLQQFWPTFRGHFEIVNGQTVLVGHIRGDHHFPLAVWLGGCALFGALLVVLGAPLLQLGMPLMMAAGAVAVTVWGVWLGRHARAALLGLITEALE